MSHDQGAVPADGTQAQDIAVREPMRSGQRTLQHHRSNQGDSQNKNAGKHKRAPGVNEILLRPFRRRN